MVDVKSSDPVDISRQAHAVVQPSQSVRWLPKGQEADSKYQCMT